MSERMSVKAADLKSFPTINPALFFAVGAATDMATNSQVLGLPWYAYLFGVIILIGCITILTKIWPTVETPANIRARLRHFTNMYNKYGDQRSSRKSLGQYLADLSAQGIPDTHFALTNFYVASANTAATFTPMRDGISSPEAVRLALAAGCRYLDMSIWRKNAEYNFAPFVAEMDAGSNWRRITMNEITFRTAMDAVAQYGMAGPAATADINEAPYRDDPLFIMLRFMGKPRAQTFNEVAHALHSTIEPFRLDFTFNNARGMDRLFKTPITQFYRKVIIISNIYPPVGNVLNDYINIGPRSSTPLEMLPRTVLSIPEGNRAQFIAQIQQNFTVVRNNMEEPDGNANTWDFKAAHAIGVHFAAMNYWDQNDKLAAYRSPDMFGVSSWKMKPEHMRYIIVYAKPPDMPNPALNARDGKPAAPPSIQLPG